MADNTRGRPSAPPGYRLIHHPLIDSTSEEARRIVADGAPDRTIVWADAQTAGRGRRGRNWASPVGNLYCSIILRPAIPLARAAELSFLAAVALAEAVETRERRLTLKWPNDVLLDGAKLAGILLDAVGSGQLDAVIIGIGVNLSSAPEGLAYATTHLGADGATPPTPDAFLGRLVTYLETWLSRWERSGFAPVREAWIARAERLGRPITVALGDRVMEGVFAGLAADGALILEGPDGVIAVHAGDVLLARS